MGEESERDFLTCLWRGRGGGGGCCVGRLVGLGGGTGGGGGRVGDVYVVDVCF